jgi:hypothetical protein
MANVGSVHRGVGSGRRRGLRTAYGSRAVSRPTIILRILPTARLSIGRAFSCRQDQDAENRSDTAIRLAIIQRVAGEPPSPAASLDQPYVSSLGLITMPEFSRGRG